MNVSVPRHEFRSRKGNPLGDFGGVHKFCGDHMREFATLIKFQSFVRFNLFFKKWTGCAIEGDKEWMKFLMSLPAFCLRAASCKSICSSQLTDLRSVWMLLWAFCKVSWTNSPIKLSSEDMRLRFAACCVVVCTVTFLADVEASTMEDGVLDPFGLLRCTILREDRCLEMWWSYHQESQ